MSWHFQSIASASTLSQSAFLDGEQVVCLIYKDVDKGEIGRADIRSEEVDRFELPGELLGRWFQTVKKPESGQSIARQKVASAEEFFFSLYTASGDTGGCEEINALKYLLALMLERKRVVRAQGKRLHEGVQSYIHIKTKQTFAVPITDISVDLMVRIQKTLGDILL